MRRSSPKPPPISKANTKRPRNFLARYVLRSLAYLEEAVEVRGTCVDMTYLEEAVAVRGTCVDMTYLEEAVEVRGTCVDMTYLEEAVEVRVTFGHIPR